jgi:uncharacterized protein (DUF1697 family)
MTRLAAMLRAVNVGGRKLLMADLTRIATQVGFEAPSTLQASGNLLFGTTTSPSEAGAQLEAAILADQGLATDVFVREHAALAAVSAANPFREEARSTPSRLMAMFLNRDPQGTLQDLVAACAMGEQVRPGPGCLYLWYPEGAGASKLTTALIERRLGVRGTARNWNTVGKLVERLATG